MRPNPNKGAWPRWVLLVPLLVLGLASARWLGPAMPACLFHQHTEFLCPGCGSTRAAVALSEGRIIEAVRNNLLFVSGFVFGGLWILLAAIREKFPKVRFLQFFRIRLSFLWVILGLLLSFGILRNFPGFEIVRPR
jgi:hypothetical protein